MKRCWEEARRLGAALAASPHFGRAELAADLREVDRHFESPHAPEEEAMHTFLGGVVAALEAGAAYPSNSRADDD
jgi:hypothetical protein